MRGLKPLKLSNDYTSFVASFTDAWIETGLVDSNVAGTAVASFTDAWIETSMATPGSNMSIVASFTDAWIETAIPSSVKNGLSRIFYRCVD